MSPENKTARTVKTLIRVGRALRDSPPETDGSAAPGGGLGSVARRAAERVTRDPRLQGAAAQFQELRAGASARADQRLETLIGEARARRGQTPPDEVAALLDRRRQERDARLERGRARQALLAHGQNDEQRRVLTLVAAATPWAGGEAAPVRYTALLDGLAPGGSAAAEMAIHRALWTLAEARVLAVSPHGLITAVQTLPPALPAALPGT